MTARPTLEDQKEKIAKLPQWAQTLIHDLDGARRDAARVLNQFVDEQTPSPFYSDEWASDGEQRGPKTKRRFFQADTMIAEHLGILLRVGLRQEGIEIQWENIKGGIRPEIGLVPTSFQHVRIPGRIAK